MNFMSFRAVTLRLRPNKHQQKVLEETRLICMRLWNHLKDECIATYMETGRVMSVYDLNALIPRRSSRNYGASIHIRFRTSPEGSMMLSSAP